MLTQELKDIIESLKDTQSDTSFVEVNSCADDFPKRMWETVSAFSNALGGGVIILGVDERDKDVKIVGVNEPFEFQKLLRKTCSSMTPAVEALIEIHNIDGKLLVTAEIPEASYKEKPVFYQGSGMISGSFIRDNHDDRPLTQYEVQSLLDGRGQPRYDCEPVKDSSINDLDPERLRLFLSRVRENNQAIREWDDEKILHTYHVLVSYEGKNVATLAGILCFGLYPQQFFPSLVTQVMVYPPKSSNGEKFLDNIRVEGSLSRVISEVVKTIQKTGTVPNQNYKGTVPNPEYPETFLRDAITNALVHRDYSPLARGTSVQVKIFPEKIEIVSPGGLFGPVTHDRLGESGLGATRNSSLMKILENIPVDENGGDLGKNRGPGIPAMIHALRQKGMEPPQFASSLTQFKVICFNQPLMDKKTLLWLEPFIALGLNERQQFALGFIYNKGKLKIADYCRMNECDLKTASIELGELVEKNILFQHGNRRWAYYSLSKIREGETKKTELLRKNRREEIIAIVKSRGEMSRLELKEILMLSNPGVLYWLRRLVKEKALEPTTDSVKDRAVKYRVKEARQPHKSEEKR